MLTQEPDESGGGESASTVSLRGTPPPPPHLSLPEGAGEVSRPGCRRRSTVLGVTEEARRVLDQLLKRSLSHNDASPYLRASGADMHVIEEHPRGAGDDGTLVALRSNSYQLAAGGGEQQESPGYVYTHQLLPEKPGSVSSEEEEEEEEGERELSLSGPGRPPLLGRKPRRDSSSSTEDYEYVDNELLTRRKKSFFRRAAERLQQNFRRAGLESPKRGAMSGRDEKPVKKKKKKRFGLSLKRNASEKSKSSSTPNEAVGVEARQQRPAGRTSSGENGSVCVATAEDTDGLTDERKRKSPLPWKGRRKDASEERDTRGIFENILRQIRKGSMRLRRKGSKGDWFISFDNASIHRKVL